MIQANEIRIGNWITCMYGTYQVVDVMCDSINLPHVEGLPYDEADGVPLTEEWLIKGGFKKCDTDITEYWIDQFMIHKDAHGKWFFMLGPIMDGKLIIDYVHELQNLFYGLKKIELTFNLK